MSKLYNTISLLLILVLSTSCSIISNEEGDISSQSIARVSSNYLTVSDLLEIVPENISQEDSILLVHRYINSWIEKQLILDKANTGESLNMDEIEAKIERLREELIITEYKRTFVNENLDKETTKAEIEKYYNEHLKDYFLHQNIFKGYFVKLSQDSPNISKFERLFKSSRASDFEDLKAYCFQYADSQYLNDSIWFVFDDVIANTPLADNSDPKNLLKNKKYIEASDDEYRYYFKVNEYKTNDTAPLELVEDEIRHIIISKRKQELLEKLNEELYVEGENTNTIEKYYK